MRKTARLCLVTALAALTCLSPAAAAVYTVTLINGNTFDTRYAPMEDATDPGKIQLLTETGNWITLPRAIVGHIESGTEAQGFGRVIAANTVELGFSLNDAAEPGEEGATPDSAAALLRYFQGQDERSYSVQQFVEPEEAGGIPVNWTGTTTPPMGSIQRYVEPN